MNEKEKNVEQENQEISKEIIENLQELKVLSLAVLREIVRFIIFSYFFMELWDGIVVEMFNVPIITFLQSMGLMYMFRIIGKITRNIEKVKNKKSN